MSQKQQPARESARHATPPRIVHRDGIDEQDAARLEWVVGKQLDALRQYEVPAPPAWAGRATPDAIYPGQCFDRSFRFAIAVPPARRAPDPDAGDPWLVHGEYCGFHRHAWVELPGDIVFDGVNQRFYDRRGYYKAVYASPWYLYSPAAAVVISIHMTPSPNGMIRLGDWHIPLGLPWADPENPTRIGYKEAAALLEERGLRPQPARPARGRKKNRPSA